MTLQKLLSVGRSLELSKQQAEEIERAVSIETSVMVQRRPVTCEKVDVISTSKQLLCSKGKTRHKCGKIGHFAKLQVS